MPEVHELDPAQFEGDPVAQWLFQQLLAFSASCDASCDAEVAAGPLVGRRVAFVVMEDMHVKVSRPLPAGSLFA
jgi:hypothetical protein